MSKKLSEFFQLFGKTMEKTDKEFEKTHGFLKLKMDCNLKKEYSTVVDNLKEIKILVMGGVSSGKSSLINDLLGDRICVETSSVGTSGITFIKKRVDKTLNEFHFKDKPSEKRMLKDGEEKDMKKLVKTLYKESQSLIKRVRRGKSTELKGLTHMTYSRDCSILDYVTIVDTPGLNDKVELDRLIEEYSKKVEIIIYIVNMAVPMTVTDVNNLLKFKDKWNRLFIVGNKMDIPMDDFGITLEDGQTQMLLEIEEHIGTEFNPDHLHILSLKNKKGEDELEDSKLTFKLAYSNFYDKLVSFLKNYFMSVMNHSISKGVMRLTSLLSSVYNINEQMNLLKVIGTEKTIQCLGAWDLILSNHSKFENICENIIANIRKNKVERIYNLIEHVKFSEDQQIFEKQIHSRIQNYIAEELCKDKNFSKYMNDVQQKMKEFLKLDNFRDYFRIEQLPLLDGFNQTLFSTFLVGALIPGGIGSTISLGFLGLASAAYKKHAVAGISIGIFASPVIIVAGTLGLVVSLITSPIWGPLAIAAHRNEKSQYNTKKWKLMYIKGYLKKITSESIATSINNNLLVQVTSIYEHGQDEIKKFIGDLAAQPVDLNKEIKRGIIKGIIQLQTQELNLEIEFNPRTKFEFEKQNQIGTGSFGEVFACTYRNAEIAVERCMVGVNVSKQAVTQKYVTNNPKIMGFYLQEIKNMIEFSNSGFLIKYLGSGWINGELCILTELGKCDLSKLIADKGIKTMRHKLKLIIQISRGIKYLHENGAIHRNLKPANILIDQQGNAKIDLGSSTQFSSNSTGTPLYMAPEILKQNDDLGIDIWAFGLIIYQIWDLVTEEELDNPVRKFTPFVFKKESKVTARVSYLAKRCLDPDPKRRISIRDLVRELDLICHDEFKDLLEKEKPSLLDLQLKKGKSSINDLDNLMKRKLHVKTNLLGLEKIADDLRNIPKIIRSIGPFKKKKEV